MNLSNLTQKTAAELLSTTPRTIRDWEKSAGLPRNADGTYDAPAIVRWLIDHRTNTEFNLNAERARLAKEQADKTALDNAVRRGELLDVETVGRTWQAILIPIRSNMLAMPTKLAPQLAAAKDPITVREILSREVRQILQDASEYKPQPADLSAALGETEDD